MSLTKNIQSKGGLAVARKAPPYKCPKCGWYYPWHYLWHNHLGHLGLHGLADKYFGGDIKACQKHLRENGLARQDPMPWNGAWPKYKPLPGGNEQGHAMGGSMAPGSIRSRLTNGETP